MGKWIININDCCKFNCYPWTDLMVRNYNYNYLKINFVLFLVVVDGSRV